MEARSKLVLGDFGGIRGISVRYLSAYAKNKGIPTKLLFPLIPRGTFGHAHRLSLIQKKLIMEFFIKEKVTHFGCYLMTGHLRAFRELVIFLRESGWNGAIIAGGVHATVCPEETLFEGVDYVVMGPGEDSLIKIIRDEDPLNISGLCYRVNGGVKKSDIFSEAYLDLDDLPFPDYDMKDHVIIRNDRLEALTPKIFRELSNWGGTYYYLTTTRGCPYNCAYCCNVERNKLRRATVDKVIEELKYAKRKLPFLQGINVQDDSFFMGSDKWLEEFSTRVKRDFNWPFIARIMPKYATENRLKYLREGGLRYASIGLQGSERLNRELYQRKETNQSFIQACQNMANLGIYYIVDVILDVIYETEDDLREVARTLNKLKRPFKVLAYGMTPFPGSIFYEKVKDDGLLQQFGADAYESMFTATRPGTYKTPSYWRNLIQNIIPLTGSREIDRLIEANPMEAWAAERVKHLNNLNIRKMRLAEWGRQKFPYIFNKSLFIYNLIRKKLF